MLPKTDDHVRRLKMLENDVAGMDGEAVLLETVALDRAQEEKVVWLASRQIATAGVREFIDKCDDFEKEIAKDGAEHFTYAELEENDVDLKKLQGWLEKIRKAGFLRRRVSPRRQATNEGLRGPFRSYAQRVFDAHDENK